MKRTKTTVLLAAALASSWLNPVLVQAETLTDYDAETQAALQDNTLEYGELEALVSVYNPAVSESQQNLDNEMFFYEDALQDFERNASDLDSEAEEAKKEGDKSAHDAYKNNADNFRRLARQYRDTVKNGRRSASNKEIKQLKSTMTESAQALMCSYEEMKAGRELAEKTLQVANSNYEIVKTQAQLGVSSEADVVNAKKSVDSAANALARAESSLTEVKQNLCIMTGWSYDASPDIRPVPEPDPSQIDSVDLASDKVKAIGNNYALIAQRGGARESTNKAKTSRARSVEEGEQVLGIEIERLYQDMLSKRTEKEAADTAYQSALTVKNTEDSKFAMGLTSKADHLKAEQAFLEIKADKVSADMDLLQAMEAYSWGVQGMAEVDV